MSNRLNPFKLGLLQRGQFYEHQAQIDMLLKMSVQAVIDSGDQPALLIHWAGFALAIYTSEEPANRYVQEAIKRG